MPFTKEQAREAGRKSKRGKGKVNQETKAFINNFIGGYLESDLEEDFKELTPKERIKVVTDLMPYVMPKMTATDLNVSELKIEEKRDLSKLTVDELERLREISSKIDRS